MQFLHAFDLFDPLAGEMPPRFTNDFAYAAERARKIHRNRTGEELKAALNYLNAILRKEEYDFLVSRIHSEREKSEFISPVILLRKGTGKYAISGWKDFPNASWPELFAVLTPAHIGNAFLKGIGGIRLEGTELELYLTRFAGELAHDGLDAVSFAEELLSKKEPETSLVREKAKEIVSLQNSENARKRYEKQTALKWEFIRLYESNSFPTIAEAIRQFEAISLQGKKDLPKEGYFETFFRRALKAHKEGTLHPLNDSDEPK